MLTDISLRATAKPDLQARNTEAWDVSFLVVPPERFQRRTRCLRAVFRLYRLIIRKENGLEFISGGDFCASPLVPVMVIDDLNQAVPMTKALAAGGITVYEVTLRTPAALQAIKAIREALPDALVGKVPVRC